MKFRIKETANMLHYLEDVEFDTLDEALEYCFSKYDKLWSNASGSPERYIVLIKNPTRLDYIKGENGYPIDYLTKGDIKYGYVRQDWDYEIEIYNDYRE